MEEVHREIILRASVNVLLSQCVLHLKVLRWKENAPEQRVNPLIQAFAYIKLHGRAHF